MRAAQTILNILVLSSLTLIIGCGPNKEQDGRGHVGRLGRSNSSSAVGNGSAYSSPNPATSWGSITSMAGDQVFDQELYYFTGAQLYNAPADQQLGYVSSQQGSNTGVVFWGYAPLNNGRFNQSFPNGTVNSSARLHIEIYDSNYGQPNAEGSVTTQTVVHIGSDAPGFKSAGGNIVNGQATLTFQDEIGTITLQGTVQGQYFSGTILYNQAETGGDTRTLGQFNVPTCGFFVCN